MVVAPMARGFVKDMRVRWALEEIGLPYSVRLVGGAGGEKSPEHLADQPFGRRPVYKAVVWRAFVADIEVAVKR